MKKMQHKKLKVFSYFMMIPWAGMLGENNKANLSISKLSDCALNQIVELVFPLPDS